MYCHYWKLVKKKQKTVKLKHLKGFKNETLGLKNKNGNITPTLKNWFETKQFNETAWFQIQGLVNTISDLRSVGSSLARVARLTASLATEESLDQELAAQAQGLAQEKTTEESGHQEVCQLAWQGDLNFQGQLPQKKKKLLNKN